MVSNWPLLVKAQEWWECQAISPLLPVLFVQLSIPITANPSDTSDEAVFQAFHILNQFDIPVGSVRAKEGDKVYTDYTL